MSESWTDVRQRRVVFNVCSVNTEQFLIHMDVDLHVKQLHVVSSVFLLQVVPCCKELQWSGLGPSAVVDWASGIPGHYTSGPVGHWAKKIKIKINCIAAPIIVASILR